MFKNLMVKSVEFMDNHPKATKVFVSGAAAATSLFNPIVSFAEGETPVGVVDIDSITDTLVSSASSAYNSGINKVVPVLATVMGFNVVVRLVRRFVKG